MTPLRCSVNNGDLIVVEYLINQNADINAKDKCSYTPLHCAADNGLFDVVEHLVNRNVDINAKDKDDMTPLHYASIFVFLI